MGEAVTRFGAGLSAQDRLPGFVRPFTSEDVPAVAAMFAKTFSRKGRKPGIALAEYLHRLFIAPTEREPEIVSLVHVGEGAHINGFIGVIAIPYKIDGVSRRAALCSTMMVDDRDADPFAGARLLRGVLAGPQDLSLSETANAISQGMWRRSRGEILLDYSFEWRRVFKPFAYGLSVAGARNPALARLLPFAPPCDSLAGRHASFAPPPMSACRDAEIDDQTFSGLLQEFTAHYDAVPDWSRMDLAGMLADSRQKSDFGPITQRAVYRGDAPIGLFVYHARPGGVGHVLQVAAAPGRMNAVVDHLFDHGCRAGLAGLRGRSQPDLLDAMLTRNCQFSLHTASVAHARDPALLAPFKSGRAFFNGYAGESWTRLIGDDFT